MCCGVIKTRHAVLRPLGLAARSVQAVQPGLVRHL